MVNTHLDFDVGCNAVLRVRYQSVASNDVMDVCYPHLHSLVS